MADLVENILQSAAEKESKFKTTTVDKDIDVEIDEGNLLCIDPNQLDTKKIKYGLTVPFNISYIWQWGYSNKIRGHSLRSHTSGGKVFSASKQSMNCRFLVSALSTFRRFAPEES